MKIIAKTLCTLLMISGLWSIDLSVSAQSDCPKAPESCYFVRNNPSFPEGWRANEFPHCITPPNPAEAHSLDFTGNAVQEACNKLTEPAPGICNNNAYPTLSLQNIIRPEVTNPGTITYQSAIDAGLNISQWGDTTIPLNCDSNNFLLDGKYGYCTQHAFQFYLDQQCGENQEQEPEVVTDCRGVERIIEFGDNGVPTVETLNACTQLGIAIGSCNRDNVDEIRQSIQQCDHIIVIGGEIEPNGADTEVIENGNLKECETIFSIAFERNTYIPLNRGLNIDKAQKVCTALNIQPENCTLSTIIDNIPRPGEKLYSIDNIDQEDKTPKTLLERDLTNILSQNCSTNKTFTCEQDPQLLKNFPPIKESQESEEGTVSDIFPNENICTTVWGNPTCTVQDLNRVIITYEHAALWGEPCDGVVFDTCMHEKLSQYLLAEHCSPVNNGPEGCNQASNLTTDEYKQLQSKIKKAKEDGTTSPPTPCSCGGIQNYDAKLNECANSLFNINQDYLRPKYLTGANWENRAYRGDGSDITFWLQKLGGRITNYIAVLAVLFIAFNGIMLVTAAGDEDQIKNAKKGIVWTLVALVLIAFAYIIVKTVVSLAY